MLSRMLPAPQAKTQLFRLDALDGLEILQVEHSHHHYEKHVHEEYSLCLMRKGLAGIHHKGIRHCAGQYQIVLMHPDEVHACWSEGQATMSYTMLYPSAETWRGFNQEIFETDKPPYFRNVLIDDLVLHQKMSAFLRHLSTPLAAETNYRALITHLIQMYGDAHVQLKPTKVEAHVVASIQEYLHAHYRDSIRLDDLARLVDRNPSYLTRVFKKALGMPPHSYQINLRLLEAKRLLKTQKPVVDVAHKLGFADQSHFTRHFKRRYGLTPGQFQNVKNVQDFAPPF